jgi:hypothetical protein
MLTHTQTIIPSALERRALSSGLSLVAFQDFTDWLEDNNITLAYKQKDRQIWFKRSGRWFKASIKELVKFVNNPALVLEGTKN